MVGKIALTVLAGGMLVALAGCGTDSKPGNAVTASSPTKLSVLYAGSLTKLVEQRIKPDVAKRFKFELEGEGGGSTALAQMIRASLATPDVFVSAAPGVNQLLMGTANHNLVRWFLTLAEDQLVIAYSPTSRFKDDLDAAANGQLPWYQVLEKPGFRLGRTDPLLDPKGVNTLFMFQLAAMYYHQPELSRHILGPAGNPEQIFPEENLLAQLNTGQVDAIIAYKHEAVEWGVPYISLPDAINLGNAGDAKAYARASVTDKTGKVQRGAPIVFTITIPGTVSNESVAETFVKYMVSGGGHSCLVKDGFTPVQTEVGGDSSAVPAALQQLIHGSYSPGS